MVEEECGGRERKSVWAFVQVGALTVRFAVGVGGLLGQGIGVDWHCRWTSLGEWTE